ncbi:MAG TPA: glycosyltransferase [Planctomycetota bacterium]|nr:glycosyltransferase [Planctomycetota bacterium]
MKILMVTTGYPPDDLGGTAVHVQQLAEALVRDGNEVSIFCRIGDPSRSDYVTDRIEVRGIPLLRVNYNFSDARNLSAIFENPRIEELLAEEIRRYRPDLVHVHHLTCLSTTILDRVHSMAVPLVMTLHDFWMVCPKGQRITKDLEICQDLDRERCAPCLSSLWPHFEISASVLRDLDEKLRSRMRLCDALIVPSAHHRDRMLEIALDPDRVHVVAHGLDHDLIPPAVARRFPPKRIGFIGTVLPSKGVHVLLKAMELLNNPTLECHIYGEILPFHGDTTYGDRLRKFQDCVPGLKFHGRYTQEALPGILAGLDICVVPSLWYESFCLTIREAMLAGLPVVASDLGAMAEALHGIDARLLFRRNDPEDLARVLTELATDFDRYQQHTRNRCRVRTLGDMVTDTQSIYQRCLPGWNSSTKSHVPQGKRKRGKDPYATVFVPTYNGGAIWKRVLQRILEQETDFDFEVLVIDSGSRDGTDLFTETFPQVRQMRIDNREFNHGLTRNLGVSMARGEIVALLTQDALPIDRTWLQRLVDNFDDLTVAGAYCHQLPREDCNPFQRERLKGWTRGEGKPDRKELKDRILWEQMSPMDRYRLIAFDDVASSVRKAVMKEIPFERRTFGEDVAWGKAAILGGKTIVMDPLAVVVHSHNNSIFYEFKRVYLDHQNLHRLVGLRTIPTRTLVLLCTMRATTKLLGFIWRDDIPFFSKVWWSLKTPAYAFGQNLGQYLGARSAILGTEHGFYRWLDGKLRRGV